MKLGSQRPTRFLLHAMIVAVAEDRAVKGKAPKRGRASRALDCATRRQGNGYAVNGCWCVTLCDMTELLSAVLREVGELPQERQEDVAQTLLALLENERAPYRVSDRQLFEVDAAIAAVDAGEFATDEDVVRALHLPWT